MDISVYGNFYKTLIFSTITTKYIKKSIGNIYAEGRFGSFI